MQFTDAINGPRRLQKTALAITRWVGSPPSIVVHTVLFAASFAAALTHWISFDRMLLILTTIVSLEAIYLAIFIQMTLNVTNEAVEDIGEDVVEMQEDIGEIQEDVDELQEDVEEITEEEAAEKAYETAEEARKTEQRKTLSDIQADLRKLMQDIERLQKNNQHPTSV